MTAIYGFPFISNALLFAQYTAAASAAAAAPAASPQDPAESTEGAAAASTEVSAAVSTENAAASTEVAAEAAAPAAPVCPDVIPQIDHIQNTLDLMTLMTMLLSVRYMIEIKLAKVAVGRNENPADKIATPKLEDVVENIGEIDAQLKAQLDAASSQGADISDYTSQTMNEPTLTSASNYYYTQVFRPLAKSLLGKEITAGDPSTAEGIIAILKEVNADPAVNNAEITALLADPANTDLETELSTKIDGLLAAATDAKAQNVLRFMALMTMLLSVRYMIEIKIAKVEAGRENGDPGSKIATPKLKEVVKNIGDIDRQLKQQLDAARNQGADVSDYTSQTINEPTLTSTSNYYYTQVFRPLAKSLLGKEITGADASTAEGIITILNELQALLPNVMQNELAPVFQNASDEREFEAKLTAKLTTDYDKPEDVDKYDVKIAHIQDEVVTTAGPTIFVVPIRGENLDQLAIPDDVPATLSVDNQENTTAHLDIDASNPGSYNLNLTDQNGNVVACLPVTVNEAEDGEPELTNAQKFGAAMIWAGIGGGVQLGLFKQDAKSNYKAAAERNLSKTPLELELSAEIPTIGPDGWLAQTKYIDWTFSPRIAFDYNAHLKGDQTLFFEGGLDSKLQLTIDKENGWRFFQPFVQGGLGGMVDRYNRPTLFYPDANGFTLHGGGGIQLDPVKDHWTVSLFYDHSYTWFNKYRFSGFPPYEMDGANRMLNTFGISTGITLREEGSKSLAPNFLASFHISPKQLSKTHMPRFLAIGDEVLIDMKESMGLLEWGVGGMADFNRFAFFANYGQEQVSGNWKAQKNLQAGAIIRVGDNWEKDLGWNIIPSFGYHYLNPTDPGSIYQPQAIVETPIGIYFGGNGYWGDASGFGVLAGLNFRRMANYLADGHKDKPTPVFGKKYEEEPVVIEQTATPAPAPAPAPVEETEEPEAVEPAEPAVDTEGEVETEDATLNAIGDIDFGTDETE